MPPVSEQIQEAADITAGGVVLPITAREKPVAGTVVRTGPGKRPEDGAERKAPQVRVPGCRCENLQMAQDRVHTVFSPAQGATGLGSGEQQWLRQLEFCSYIVVTSHQYSHVALYVGQLSTAKPPASFHVRGTDSCRSASLTTRSMPGT